jgi:molybdenum cofactor cytidylyltransferase
MMRIAALVLAAGEGKRFGGKKQLAEVSGEIMLRHVLKQLPVAELCGIYCILGAYRDEIKDQIADLAQLIEFADWQQGMGASLAYGISHIPGLDTLDGIMICLGDQAALHTSHYKQLLDSFNRQQISAAWYAGKAGVPAIFPLAYKTQLSQLDGDQGAKKILQSATQINNVPIAEAGLDLDYAEQLITGL